MCPTDVIKQTTYWIPAKQDNNRSVGSRSVHHSDGQFFSPKFPNCMKLKKFQSLERPHAPETELVMLK